MSGGSWVQSLVWPSFLFNKENNPEEENEDSNHTVNDCERYIIPHPKYNTHMRIHQFENHVYLPNIIGPWLPH
jgi:hypothetical protein